METMGCVSCNPVKAILNGKAKTIAVIPKAIILFFMTYEFKLIK
jgi:hypothetical protein